jgi:hypothetical protein
MTLATTTKPSLPAPATYTFGNATQSGKAWAVTVVLKLAGFTKDVRCVDIVHQVLAQVQSMMSQSLLGIGQWLQALSYVLSQPREIAIVNEPEAADTRALLNVVRKGDRPLQVVALSALGPQGARIPVFEDCGLVEGQGEHARSACLRLPRPCLPGTCCRSGGTAGTGRATMILYRTSVDLTQAQFLMDLQRCSR